MMREIIGTIRFDIACRLALWAVKAADGKFKADLAVGLIGAIHEEVERLEEEIEPTMPA